MTKSTLYDTEFYVKSAVKIMITTRNLKLQLPIETCTRSTTLRRERDPMAFLSLPKWRNSFFELLKQAHWNSDFNCRSSGQMLRVWSINRSGRARATHCRHWSFDKIFLTELLLFLWCPYTVLTTLCVKNDGMEGFDQKIVILELQAHSWKV